MNARVRPNMASGLHWVRGEIEQSLSRVRTLVEQHAETRGDALPLQQAFVELHQVRGTAAMIQCHGVAIVAEEMKLAIGDLLHSRCRDADAAYSTLLGGTVLLNEYIEALSEGMTDCALVLQPTINELRLARGKAVLTEADLFALQLHSAGLLLPLPEDESRVSGVVEQHAQKYLNTYQAALLSWLKDQSDAGTSLARIGKVAEVLAGLATDVAVHQLWRVVAATVEALLGEAMEDSLDIKRLVGRTVSQLRELATHGEAAAAAQGGDLALQLLYYIGRSEGRGPRVTVLRKAFQLVHLLPPPAQIEEYRRRIHGPNTALLNQVAVEIRNDFTKVKDVVDLAVRLGGKGGNFETLQTSLKRIGDTLAVLGLVDLQRVVVNQTRMLDQVSRSDVPTATIWMELATSILRVEHSLEDALFKQLRHSDEGHVDAIYRVPHSRDLAEGIDALYREALVNLAKLRTFVDGFERGQDSSSMALLEAIKLMEEVAAVFRILQDDRAGALTGQLADYVRNTSFSDMRAHRDRAERFADAIVAVEYYVEARREGVTDVVSLLDRLSRCVEQLDLPIDFTLAPGATPENPLESTLALLEQTADLPAAATEPETASAPAPAPAPAAVEAPAAVAAPAPVTAPSSAADEVDPEIREVFLEEAGEVLATLQGALPRWKREPDDRDALGIIRRAFHTLKGSGRMVGAQDIGEFGWAVEQLLNKCLDGSVAVTAAVATLVDEAVSALPALIEQFREGAQPGAELRRIVDRAGNLAAGRDSGEDEEEDLLAVFCDDAREKLLSINRWLAEQPRDQGAVEIADLPVRAYHTLRGAGYVVSANAVGDLSAALEAHLEALRAADLGLREDDLQLLAEANETLLGWINELGSPGAAAQDAGPWLERLNQNRKDVPEAAVQAAEDRELAEIFCGEAFDLVQSFENTVLAWERSPDSRQAPEDLRIVLHTLKGAAYMSNCKPVGDVAKILYARIEDCIARRIVPDAPAFQALKDLSEGLYQQLDAYREHRLRDDDPAIAQAEAFAWAPASAAPAPARPLAAPPVVRDAAAAADAVAQIEQHSPAADTLADEAVALTPDSALALQTDTGPAPAPADPAGAAMVPAAGAPAAGESEAFACGDAVESIDFLLDEAPQAEGPMAADTPAVGKLAFEAAEEPAQDAPMSSAEDAAGFAETEPATDAGIRTVETIDFLLDGSQPEIPPVAETAADIDALTLTEPSAAQEDGLAGDVAAPLDGTAAADPGSDAGGRIDFLLDATPQAEAPPAAAPAAEATEGAIDFDLEWLDTPAADAAPVATAAEGSAPAEPEFLDFDVAQEPAQAVDGGAMDVIDLGDFDAPAESSDAVGATDLVGMPSPESAMGDESLEVINLEGFDDEPSSQDPAAPAEPAEAASVALPDDGNTQIRLDPAAQGEPTLEALDLNASDLALEPPAPTGTVSAETGAALPQPLEAAEWPVPPDGGDAADFEVIDLAGFDAPPAAGASPDAGAEAADSGSGEAAGTTGASEGLDFVLEDVDLQALDAGSLAWDGSADAVPGDAPQNAEDALDEAALLALLDDASAVPDSGAEPVAPDADSPPAADAASAASAEHYSLSDFDLSDAPSQPSATEPAAEPLDWNLGGEGEGEGEGEPAPQDRSAADAHAAQDGSPPADPTAPELTELAVNDPALFLAEAEALLTMLGELRRRIEFDPADADVNAEARAYLRQLQQSAGLAGFPGIHHVAQQLELLLAALAHGERAPNDTFFGRLEAALDGLRLALDDVSASREEPPAPDAGVEATDPFGIGLDQTLPDDVSATLPSDLSTTLPEVYDTLQDFADPVPAASEPVEPISHAAPEAPQPAVAPPVAPPDAPIEHAPAGRRPVPEDYDEELGQLFSGEAAELLESLNLALQALRSDATNPAPLRELQRVLHTLKGGARMAGLNVMGDVAHDMETRVNRFESGLERADAAALEALEAYGERLHQLHDLLERGDVAPLMQATEPANAPEAPFAPGPGAAEPTAASPLESGEPTPQSVAQAPTPPPATLPAEAAAAATSAARVASGWDPLLFWRPDEEVETTVRRETARVSVDVLDNMLNEAGEISIFRSRLEEANTAMQAQLTEMAQAIARVRDQLRQLDAETEAQISARGVTDSAEADRYAAEFDPLEMDRYTRMQELSRALSESVGDLGGLHGAMDQLAGETETILMQQGRVTTLVQQGLMRTLMVPFSRQVGRLQRVVRQTASDNGKQAEVVFSGIESELDRNVLERMTAPLEHLLRNAVVHGIEEPEARVAAGKPELGNIAVSLYREGSQLLIELRDDGRGLDFEAIRAQAIRRGLMPPDAKVSDEAAAQFIFQPGFSTAKQLTQDAGRGIGMDVVASEVKQLGGTLELSSQPGEGTRFLVRLPLTLAMSQALLLGVGPEQYAILLNNVEGIARVPREQLDALYGEDGKTFTYGGAEYRVRYLGDYIGVPRDRSAETRTMPLVMIRLGEGLVAGERRIAVVVDQLFGNREVVTKAVGPQISSINGVSGATILADGRVVLILDPAALAQDRARRALSAMAQRRHELVREAEDARPLIMVVDDSITIRRVTERLLLKNNYRVLTAKDGLDAMARLQSEAPAAILLDIEMPRADGFEVAAFVRNTARIAGTPIIMITSRSGDKHRERARSIGVDRYMIKPYQEDQLMQELRAVLKEVQA